MKLYRVPILRDEQAQRGSLIYSISAGTMAFLDKEGKLHHFDSAQTFAILCLMDDLHDAIVSKAENIPWARWYAMTKSAKALFVEPILTFPGRGAGA